MSDEPVILLLHGVESSRSTWRRATHDLSDLGWSVLAVDLLGQAGRLAPRSSSASGHSINRVRPALWLNAIVGFAAALDLRS